MGISFYMSNTLNKFDIQGENVDLSEELGSFLYKNQEKFSDDVNVLVKLDPYGDSVLKSDEIQKVHNFCEEILKSNTIKMYDDEQEASTFFTEIKRMSQEALEKERKILAFGD